MKKKAWEIAGNISANVKRIPTAYSQMLMALDFGLGPSYEVVIASNSRAKDSQAMLRALRKKFLPNKVLLFVPSESPSSEISQFAEFTQYQSSINGKATAYVCRNYACNKPTTDISEMLEMMKK